MNYDRKIHITTEQLAELMGVPAHQMAGGVRKRGGPVALGRATVNGRQQSIYCRFAAVEWVDEQRGNITEPPKRDVVQPRQRKPLHEQGTYRPSAELSANFARAGELYSHRMITPTGIGNHREFMYGHDRVRLAR